MSRIEETRTAIDMVADQMIHDPRCVQTPACLLPILSDIALSLAAITDEVELQSKLFRTIFVKMDKEDGKE